ncbi:Hypothetical Protein RradSPS_2493 [Rubrobacter radiotolerans]|uniref:Uncharacterized protein n=1 Tax=Rubrobacter radiotolerans TaxID=42256 RepID=A0A023X6C5_RUBRA|nr:hypothetical protein [Rubrobacter radiotolerans]AHY47776.1 Hypothetical Protein RradSPS_2493 [Rubrobacter radiotolerans]MDX5892415.1 hypothetical protein [Rubrobacter radiotolerans]SMC07706.1 conserved hypothetical protein [Rubrobacter radiotolerans DSM 5868]
MSSTQSSPVARLLQRVEEYVEDWRRRDAEHKAEADMNRERLWNEAREREAALREMVSREEGEDQTLGEVTTKLGTVFVVHSAEAGGALQEFAATGARLSHVIPGSGRNERGEDRVHGSWLVFDRGR